MSEAPLYSNLKLRGGYKLPESTGSQGWVSDQLVPQCLNPKLDHVIGPQLAQALGVWLWRVTMHGKL